MKWVIITKVRNDQREVKGIKQRHTLHRKKMFCVFFDVKRRKYKKQAQMFLQVHVLKILGFSERNANCGVGISVIEDYRLVVIKKASRISAQLLSTYLYNTYR